jgi:hypothetical protein
MQFPQLEHSIRKKKLSLETYRELVEVKNSDSQSIPLLELLYNLILDKELAMKILCLHGRGSNNEVSKTTDPCQ